MVGDGIIVCETGDGDRDHRVVVEIVTVVCILTNYFSSVPGW